MRKLTLDYSTWRCGGEGSNKLGKGNTEMLNKEGYLCCLGQLALQVGATKYDILHSGTPYTTPVNLDYLTEISGSRRKNTNFSVFAMVINDDVNTTPEEKIEKLTLLCEENGIQLEVINKPINA